MTDGVTTTWAGYGGRPVSIDIARGRPLLEFIENTSEPGIGSRPRPLTHHAVADRLALAHWPSGHQIVVCSLTGGTGRTTLSGLIGTVLTELPYAHLRRPVALVETNPPGLSVTPRRWGIVDPEPGTEFHGPAGCTLTGAWAFQDGPRRRERTSFSILVIDAPSGLPSEVSAVAEDPTASVILLTRPDRASPADAADALVWMHRHSQVTRDRVTVVINEGIGKSDRHAKAAGAVLGIRCTAVHRLGPNPTLAPGLVLPSGEALPTRLRRRIASICLDGWSTIRHHPTHFTPEEKP